MKAIDKLIATAEAELSYLEKKSNKDLDDKTSNAGSSNYTKYNRDLKAWTGVGSISAQWCQAFVDWVFITAFGLEGAKKLIYTWTNYTPTGSGAFKKRGRYIKRGSGKPKRGDVIYRSSFVNVNIPKATATTFTLRFQMWELSDAWGSSRVVSAPLNFTLWSDANADGNGDQTFNTSGQAISYLTYRISLAAKSVDFERYALSGSSYVKNDEGSYVMGKLAISLAEGRTVSDISVAQVVITDDAGSSQTKTISSSILSAALSANGYVEASPGLFASISFNTG